MRAIRVLPPIPDGRDELFVTASTASASVGSAPRSVASSFRVLLGSAVVFFLVLLASSWVASLRDLRSAHRREALLLERIETTELRNQELEQKIERLRDDPLMLERLAREQLGLVREGEVVVVFPEESGD